MDISYNTTETLTKLEGLRAKPLTDYYDQVFLDTYLSDLRSADTSNRLSFRWYPYNPPGHWLSANINRPSKVIERPITLEVVCEELDTGKYDYLVVAVYLTGYSTFRQIARHVRKHYPRVKIVAASQGALLPETAELADFTLKGSLVHDLRAVIGQPTTDPLHVVTCRSDTVTSFGGFLKRSSLALLISSLGCMYGCDFCPATAQFGTTYVAPFGPEAIRDALIRAHEEIAPSAEIFTVSLAEAQGLGNHKLWKEVFRLCRDLPFQCELVSTTSSKVIQKYTLDELCGGDLSLSTVNIGVESLVRTYAKNKGVDLKAEIARLQAAGVNVVATYIVGLDWQTKEIVREEVKLLKDLGASGYIISNLEMQPNSPLYNTYNRAGRLLDVPPELLSFYGFQAFRHPHFASGFQDMLPLLAEIEEELTTATRTFSASLEIYLNRRSTREAERRATLRRITEDFKRVLGQNCGYEPGQVAEISDWFAAQAYFHLAFRNMDLFHPFILHTN